MPIAKEDQWQLLYMVHSAVQQPMEAYITYDIDFVPIAKAQQIGLKPAYPVWLDVRPSGYPVFNVQRSLRRRRRHVHLAQGGVREVRPLGPARSPARASPATAPARTSACRAPGSRSAASPTFEGGTLIGIGGHLHPGGMHERDRPRAQRPGQTDLHGRGRLLGLATTPSQAGGPPTSWDFSMKVTGLPKWGVHVEPGDVLRSNATYDTEIASTYENMGIAIALLAPDENGTPTAPGLDPFTAPKDTADGCPSGGLNAATPTLCDKGQVTHGHYKENAQPQRPVRHVERAARPADRPGRDRQLPLHAG